MQSKHYLNDPHDAYEIEKERQQHERHSSMKDARMLGRGRELDNLPEDLAEEMEAQKGKVPFSKAEAARSRTMRKKMEYVLNQYGRDLLEVSPGAEEDAMIAAIDSKREEERLLHEYGSPVMPSVDENSETPIHESDDETLKDRRGKVVPFVKPNRRRGSYKNAA